MGSAASTPAKEGTVHQSDKISMRRPPEKAFKELIASDKVVVDQETGHEHLDRYHNNVTGTGRGWCRKASEREWIAANRKVMEKYSDWQEIDFESPEAPDPDFMFQFGAIRGKGIDMEKMRPMVVEAQKRMIGQYSDAFAKAESAPGAKKIFDAIRAAEDRTTKVVQPQGKNMTIIELYKGALGAATGLWDLGEQAVKSSGESEVHLTWGIKKPSRIWYKLNTKYNNDVSCVTDCCRISLNFRTAQGLLNAANFIGAKACSFKNRIANPTSEGYRDLMFTVKLPTTGGAQHVCEVQLHMVSPVPRLATQPRAHHENRAESACKRRRDLAELARLCVTWLTA